MVDMEVLSCAEKACHTLFAIPDAVVMRLRSTHESFCCPFGHHQSYSEKTQADLLREQLKAAEARAAKAERAARAAARKRKTA